MQNSSSSKVDISNKRDSFNMQQSHQQSKQDGIQINLGANIEIHEPRVQFCDMSYEMRQFAFEQAELAFKLMYKGEKRYFKDVAEFIKNQFDEKFKGSWHVIVGKNFGSHFSFEAKSAIQFWINHIVFLIYKFG